MAALAATGAFAQSSVTISGNLDFAAGKVSGTQVGQNGTTVSTASGLVSSTSVLRFIAVEDLGGGMKATAQYNFDPRSLANDSLANTLNSATAPTANTTTGLARDELFVGLSGGFGNVRLGSPNSLGLAAHSTSSPLGTGIGSGYSGGGTAGTMTNSYVQTRYSRSVRYDTPNIAGFTASLVYAPGNDQVPAAATTALSIPNNRKATEFGLSYSAGPLNASFANVRQAAQTNPTGWYSVAYPNAAAPADNPAKTSVNVLGVNYNLGATTLYAGWNKGDRLAVTSALDGTAVKTKGMRIAAKHTIGAVDLIAQYTTQTSGTGTAELKAKVTGLRADYNLSKTAAVYAGYEKYDTGNATANDRKIASLGLRKSF